MSSRFPFMGFAVFSGFLLGTALIARAGKRCDLLIKSTPGGDAACLDLVAMKAAPGTAIHAPGNATRISRDGLVLCKNAFLTAAGGEADLVFIYDNSGSMLAKFAWIDPATRDTAFYFTENGCASPIPQGTLPLQTAEGVRSVGLLASNAGCKDRSGDPYNARGAAIRQAIDFLGTTSPGSTAAAVGFNDNLAHQQPPIQLNNPAALAQIKSSIVLDTTGGTKYGPPLRQSTVWLTDPSLTKTAKQAVVFISDGAPTDTLGAANYVNSINAGIPIFSIFLGDPASQFAKLQDMSTRTGGRFYRVEPGKPDQMNQVMQEIVRVITVAAIPRSVRITNSTLDPDQVSVSVSMARTPLDSNVSVVLDSILALKEGSNDMSVQIVLSDVLAETYSFKVQADGPAATQSAAGLACYDPPTLAMLNPANQVDETYPAGPAAYDILLTRSPSELGSVTVSAATRDSSRNQPWGDAESILLPASSLASGTAVNRRNGFPFNGSTPSPAANNGSLEGSANGLAVLTWSHPRDARETASFYLGARKIPILAGFISVERVMDVPRGVEISGPIADPVVIRGGAAITRIGRDSAVITSRGCLYNCVDASLRASDPVKTPSFIFKTAAPFSFTLHVYDNLGHFILRSKGTVKAADWMTMPRIGDSVAVVMSIIPMASNGQPVATGAYVLAATITAMDLERNDPAAPSRVSATTRTFVNKFGYLRTAHQ